jgi:hypothetical protein
MTGWSDHDHPAGARAEHSAAPAGKNGPAFLAAWKKARAEQGAASRRRTGRHRGSSYRAGMARRPPPGPDGDDAA